MTSGSTMSTPVLATPNALPVASLYAVPAAWKSSHVVMVV